MSQSESIKELMGALLKAQRVMGPAKESAENPFHKTHYATLHDVIDAIKRPLHDNSIVYFHTARDGDRLFGVCTTLYHTESGEFIESELMMPLADPGPQKVGSVITYAKRYTLQALCGISSASEDDDAQAAHTAFSPATDLMAYVDSLRESFNNEDMPGFMELWQELTDAQKVMIYRGTVNKGTGYLHSSEKTAWRTAAAEWKGDAGATD